MLDCGAMNLNSNDLYYLEKTRKGVMVGMQVETLKYQLRIIF